MHCFLFVCLFCFGVCCCCFVLFLFYFSQCCASAASLGKYFNNKRWIFLHGCQNGMRVDGEVHILSSGCQLWSCTSIIRPYSGKKTKTKQNNFHLLLSFSCIVCKLNIFSRKSSHNRFIKIILQTRLHKNFPAHKINKSPKVFTSFLSNISASLSKNAVSAF